MNQENISLKQSILEKYWSQKDPLLAQILNQMERVETWTVNDQHVNEALHKLIPKLSNAGKKELLEQGDNFINLMAYLSSSKAIRLLAWFEERFPQSGGLSADLLYRAKEIKRDDKSQILVERLQVLKSMHVLSQVFSKSRIQLINALLKQQN